MTDRPPGNLARLVRSLNLLHGAILLGFALVSLTSGVTSGGFDILHILIATIEIGAAVDLVRRGERVRQLFALVPGVLLGATPALLHPGDIAGGFAVAAFALSAARLLAGRRYVIVVLSAGIGYLVTLRVAGGHVLALDGWGVLLLSVANTYAAGAFVGSLETSARVTDELQWSADRQEVLLREHEAQDQAVRTARQVLHDDVLTALRSICEPTTTARQGPVELSRHAVRRVGGITSPDPAESAPTTIDDLLASLLTRAPLRVATRTDDGSIPLDPTRARALERALLEILRNAARHAGTGCAQLTVRCDHGLFRADVSDDGPGIADGTAFGTGLSEAVRDGIERLGGGVTFVSGSGGTTFTVRLPEADARPDQDASARSSPSDGPAEDAYDLSLSTVDDARRVMTLVALPQVAVWVLLGTASVVSTKSVGSLVVLALDLALAFVAWRRVIRAAPGRTWLVGFSAVLTLVQIASLRLLPFGGLQDLRSWSLGFAGSILVIVCFVVPARWGLLMLAPVAAAVAVAWLLDPGLGADRLPVGSINAVVNTPLIAVGLGSMVRRNGRQVAVQRDRLRAATTQLARRDALARVMDSHLDHTRRAIVPWLSQVAEGRLDPGDATVRERAAMLSHEARDDLHAPGFLDAGLRAEVSSYRSRGGAVVIRPGFAPGGYQRQVGTVVSALVRSLRAPHRITVSPDPLEPGRARVVVVPAPRSSVLPNALPPRTRTSGDRFALVLELDEREHR